MLAQELVTRCSQLAFLPNTTDFTPASILAEINTAMRMMLAPALVRVNGEFFTEILDVTPDASGYVRLPAQAISSTSRLISWIYPDGSEGEPLQQMSLADIASIVNISGSTVTFNGTTYPVSNGTPYCFTPLPDGIQVYSVPQLGACRIRYSRLFSPLVLGADGTSPPITTPLVFTTSAPYKSGNSWVIDVASTTGEGSGIPTSGKIMDIIDSSSPYRMIMQATAGGSTTLTLGAVGVVDVLVGRLLPGMYACYAYTSPVPQCPVEWHDYLMYCGAARLAGLRKDFALKAELLNDAKSLQIELTNLAQPRFKQNPKNISAWRGHTQRPWRLG